MQWISPEEIVQELNQRVLHQVGKNSRQVDELIQDTFFEEKQRLAKRSHNGSEEENFYQRAKHQFLKGDAKEHREILQQLIGRFGQEVAGHFNPYVYQVATKAVPIALNVLLHGLSPIRVLQDLPRGKVRLEDRIHILGETETLKKLAKKATIIFVPTHSSNLDSIVAGYTLFQLGLPPFIYGAGLNLFKSKVMGFFMDHLGAYKVDRLKKSQLYKLVLKNYAAYTLEKGFHHLFFPGGTRSRSGKVEEKLKLGLMGMGLNAYIQNLKNHKKHPDIFFVPCTINYQLVLEAETLIDDYLKEAGKSRYIIDDDEFSQVRRIWDFFNYLLDMDSHIQVVISKPLDPFGNIVNENGISLDPRGRKISRAAYVIENGQAAINQQRDEQYTRELGTAIIQAYQRDTVIDSVHLVSYVLFEWLQEVNPDWDLYRLLSIGGEVESIAMTDFYPRMDLVLKKLKALESEKKIRLSKKLMQNDLALCFTDALAHLMDYHEQAAIERRGHLLFHHNRFLIYYYRNRMAHLF